MPIGWHHRPRELFRPLPPATFFGPRGVAERLADRANVELRNAAAHDQTLD